MTGIPAAILDHEVIHGEEERQEEVGSFMIFWNHPISNLAFPGGSDGKASVYNAGDPGSSPGLGRGEGNGNPLQYSCLEIPWTEEPGRLQSMGSQRVGYD